MPSLRDLKALFASVLIIIGVTILFFGTPLKPTPQEANLVLIFAAPFLAGGVILYVLDFFPRKR